MSYTPFNGPLLTGLLGDRAIAAQFSVKADIEAMLRFEVALAAAQKTLGLVPAHAADEIMSVCKAFEPDWPRLQRGVERDGMAVPELVRQLRSGCSAETAGYLHFGSTSQDAVDTSLAIRLKTVNEDMSQRLQSLVDCLRELIERFGDRDLMARTRMQAALPVTVAHRLEQWLNPLLDRIEQFGAVAKEVQAVQLGGPVGSLDEMDGKGSEVRALLAAELGLLDPGCAWHTDRSRITTYCHWLASLGAVLGKFGLDFVLMAQTGLDEIEFENAGGSSAMAHKQNPVRAEVLVSQARFINSLNAAVLDAAIHEQERSGIAWTLEWMLLPQICVVAGSALNNTRALLESVTGIGTNT